MKALFSYSLHILALISRQADCKKQNKSQSINTDGNLVSASQPHTCNFHDSCCSCAFCLLSSQRRQKRLNMLLLNNQPPATAVMFVADQGASWQLCYRHHCISACTTARGHPQGSPSRPCAVAEARLFLNLSPAEGEKNKQHEILTDSEEDLTVTNSGVNQQALCWTGHYEPCKDNRSPHWVFPWTLAASCSRVSVTSSLNSVTYFWPQHFIPGHAWLGTALYTSTLKPTEGGTHCCPLWDAKSGSHSVHFYKVYAESTNDGHHQTQCPYFLQDSRQGRQSMQNLLWVPVWFKKKILCMFLYKKVTARAFSSPVCNSTGPIPTPLRARGLQPLLCPAQGFSTLSTDPSSKDNQVRWSNGPAGPHEENELWITWMLETLIEFLPPAAAKWNSEPSFTLKSLAQGCSHTYLRQKKWSRRQGKSGEAAFGLQRSKKAEIIYPSNLEMQFLMSLLKQFYTYSSSSEICSKKSLIRILKWFTS